MSLTSCSRTWCCNFASSSVSLSRSNAALRKAFLEAPRSWNNSERLIWFLQVIVLKFKRRNYGCGSIRNAGATPGAVLAGACVGTGVSRVQASGCHNIGKGIFTRFTGVFLRIPSISGSVLSWAKDSVWRALRP